MKNLQEQYKNEVNLQKRIQIHTYATAKESWYEFLSRQISLPDNCRILEIGCGTGILWKHLLKNHPQIKEIILSDFSEGMLKSAEENLAEFKNSYKMKFQKIDAVEIPYDFGYFDVVIANHVLYHVAEVEKSLSEISRVLKKDSFFYATTIGHNNMYELKNIVKKYFPNVENKMFFNRFLQNFSLENAQTKAQPFFQVL